MKFFHPKLLEPLEGTNERYLFKQRHHFISRMFVWIDLIHTTLMMR